MSYARKVDGNQGDIVGALRRVGCQVESTAATGKGKPDIIVWSPFNTRYYWCEIKRDSKAKYTPDQIDWRKTWRGPVERLETVEQALKMVGVKV